MISAVAIDDEPLSLSIIERFCEDLDGIELKKTFTEQKKAIRYINKFEVDLLFLDIRMPQQTGIDLYKNLDREIKVIFITAYEEYAIEGFNLNATDYLLKPFSFERFKESVERAAREIQLEQQSVNEKPFLDIRADYKLHRIPYGNITHIEALDDYIQIHQDHGKRLVARATMKGILKKLPKNKFVRIHRSYIVNTDKITNIGSDELKIGEQGFPISSSYKADIEDQLDS